MIRDDQSGFFIFTGNKIFINVSAGIPTITPEIVRPTKNYPEGVYRHFGWTEMVKALVRTPVIGSGDSYLPDGKNDLKEHDS